MIPYRIPPFEPYEDQLIQGLNNRHFVGTADLEYKKEIDERNKALALQYKTEDKVIFLINLSLPVCQLIVYSQFARICWWMAEEFGIIK